MLSWCCGMGHLGIGVVNTKLAPTSLECASCLTKPLKSAHVSRNLPLTLGVRLAIRLVNTVQLPTIDIQSRRY